MTTHDLKCWPEPFGLLACGIKKHEVRVDDRGFKIGDVLTLREFDFAKNAYTGRVVAATISCITRAEGPCARMLQNGAVVLGLVNVRELVPR